MTMYYTKILNNLKYIMNINAKILQYTKIYREPGHLNTELTQICQNKIQTFFINLKKQTYLDQANFGIN